MTPDEIKRYARTHVAFVNTLTREQRLMFDLLKSTDGRAGREDQGRFVWFGLIAGVVATLLVELAAAGLWWLVA